MLARLQKALQPLPMMNRRRTLSLHQDPEVEEEVDDREEDREVRRPVPAGGVGEEVGEEVEESLFGYRGEVVRRAKRVARELLKRKVKEGRTVQVLRMMVLPVVTNQPNLSKERSIFSMGMNSLQMTIPRVTRKLTGMEISLVVCEIPFRVAS